MLPIAVAQLRSNPTDPHANISKLGEYARFAAQRGAKVVLSPELYVTGYNCPDIPSHAPKYPEYLRSVARVAQDAGIDIITGLPEAGEGGVTYNTLVWVAKDGSTRAVHRKTHLWGEEEKRLYAPHGNQYQVVDFEGVRCGLLVCFEVEFVEPMRVLALKGCDVVFVITAIVGDEPSVPLQLVPTRAAENGIYVVYCNHAAPVFSGLSCVCAPNAKDVARAGEEEALLFATLDPKKYDGARRRNPYLTDRRVELFTGLLSPKL